MNLAVLPETFMLSEHLRARPVRGLALETFKKSFSSGDHSSGIGSIGLSTMRYITTNC